MVKLVRAGLGVALMLCLVGVPALAQESGDDIKQEIEALKKGQQDIQKQLEELKKLIQARPAAAPARRGTNVKDIVFNVGTKVKGPDTAKLTLIEFTDYQ